MAVAKLIIFSRAVQKGLIETDLAPEELKMLLGCTQSYDLASRLQIEKSGDP